MELFDSLVPVGIVLVCIAGVVALGALAYMLITMTKSMKETFDKVNPLIDQAQEALDATKPALERIDPLMERITLTVDAANLEIMRVDQILEDVNAITVNVSKATESLDTITSAPLDAISSVTGRLRGCIAPFKHSEKPCAATSAQMIDEKLDCVEDKVANAQARADAKRAVRDEAIRDRVASQERTNEMSSSIKDAVSAQINRDADSAQSL